MKSTFLTNYTELTFINKIKDSLSKCNSFFFSVSFIKDSGLKLILNDIKKALNRGANGRIITSTYQNFTDIRSLNIFLLLQSKYDNFKCNLDYNCFGNNGFHSKGYVFEYDDSYELIVGSSNLTSFALLKNVEWNVSIISKEMDKHYLDAKVEFDYLWNKTLPITSELINMYNIQLEFAIEKWDMDYIQAYEHNITPNYMQRKALIEIKRYRDLGANKALVIAATGSGKTYLAAFDSKNFDAKRLLYIVHRDTILKEAISTFKKVFGSKYTYGLYNGSSKQIDCDFIFSTNTMMYNNLELFSKDTFDYIIIDEAHHAAAKTYSDIMEYFTPQFILGLTATPERMDNESIFELFDKNVPYELRLREALENDLVVPFKYYGIRDNLINYSEKEANSLIKQLSSDIHLEFIHQNIQKYYPDGKLKAIGFCRTIEHAKIISEKMNMIGYHSIALSGENNTGERLRAFRDLQDDENRLNIIFTVDILNEGVDIPGINMVLFLRPTESSTIFVQQLGRGLRKYPNKDYLTVLDFIGNSYTRSVQIALALGSLSKSSIFEKKLLTDLILNDFNNLNLDIEIHIDEESKEEILKHIEATNFNKLDYLKTDYFNFKNYIKKDSIPTHMDFFNYDSSPDLIRFIKSKSNNKMNGCYYNFLTSIGEECTLLNEDQIEFLKYLSNLIPLVRPYEFYIIKSILNEVSSRETIIKNLKDEYENFNINQFNHAEKYLLNKLWDEPVKNNRQQFLYLNNDLYSLINVNINSSVYKEHIYDLLTYGLTRYESEFGSYSGMFKLYGSYQTEQIKMIMCESGLMQVQGTIVKKDGTVYILAGLKKDSSVLEHLNFNNKFLSSKVFQWESTTGVKFDNTQGHALIHSKIAHLFIRKMNEEDGITLPYTYIGTGKLTSPRSGNKSKPTLIFNIVLDEKVPEYLKYDFEVPGDEE